MSFYPGETDADVFSPSTKGDEESVLRRLRLLIRLSFIISV